MKRHACVLVTSSASVWTLARQGGSGPTLFLCKWGKHMKTSIGAAATPLALVRTDVGGGGPGPTTATARTRVGREPA